MPLNFRKVAVGTISLIGLALLAVGGWTEEAYRAQEMLFAPWGRAPGEFGLLEQAEGVGPQSLCVDEGGNIYILDLVNRRVQVFSSQGEFLRQTACGILAHDLQLDPDGNMYLLAPYHGLVQKYDAQGNLVAGWPISPQIWLIDGLRIDGQKIILRTALQTEYTVAELDGAVEPKRQLEMSRPGFGGRRSDRRYGTRWVNSHLGVLHFLDGEGQQTKEVQVTTAEELGSLIYLGEDEAGNVYLQAELLGLPTVDRLKIFKYDAGGNLVSEFTLPASDYTFVYRSLYLDPSGAIYQLLTEPDGVRVLRWTATATTEEGR